IQPEADRLLRQHQRHAVLSKGLGPVAVQVAGELIQNDDFRQSPFRAAAPVPQLAAGRPPMKLTEALADGAIQPRNLFPPIGRLELLEPEFQYRLMHVLPPLAWAYPV